VNGALSADQIVAAINSNSTGTRAENVRITLKTLRGSEPELYSANGADTIASRPERSALRNRGMQRR
jgi:hypothetical protein